MRILFDQGTPVPLRRALTGHEVATVFELGWSTLGNGELLAAAERAFDLLITTDRNIQYQRNLSNLRLAILVLPTTSWPRLQRCLDNIVGEAASMRSGEFRELT